MSATTPDAKPLPDAGEPARPRRRGPIREVGDLAGFSLKAFIETGGALRYFSEILRQAGLLITGSTLVLVGVAMVAGAECGLFGDYFLRALGAQSYVGVFTSACGLREIIPTFFGYILAAKVGCGLVAEVGSMRINEEIDAMESVGVSSMSYVVATRLIAALTIIPMIYVLALFAGDLGTFLVVSVQIGDVSRAAFENVHWGTQTFGDNLLSILKVEIFTAVIVLVGCYYGYRASGGAVGVGAATARSMVVNLVLVNVLNAIMTALFFSGYTIPVGG